MKIAIIDDSNHDIVMVERMIKTEFNIFSMEIELDIFSSFSDFQLSPKSYFAIFLDIELGEKSNGIDLKNCIPPETKTIYITNYPSYVFTAAHTSPYDFIRKDSLLSDIPPLVKKLVDSYQSEFVPLYFEKPKPLQIDPSKILYFESEGNYEICFMLTRSKPHKIRITQKELLTMLNKLPRNTFVKINKTVIINVSNVKTIHEDYVTMINNEPLPIALLNRRKTIENIEKAL